MLDSRRNVHSRKYIHLNFIERAKQQQVVHPTPQSPLVPNFPKFKFLADNITTPSFDSDIRAKFATKTCR